MILKIVILLGTYWDFFPSMKKKVTDEKISTLQTLECSERQYSARRAWQLEQSHLVKL